MSNTVIEKIRSHHRRRIYRTRIHGASLIPNGTISLIKNKNKQTTGPRI